MSPLTEMKRLTRSEQLARLRRETFDVLVIGGGITGAGIAQDAAHRGLSVTVIDKSDFGSGTTHASTKLLHGGLRYLEQGQLRLMYEALRERNLLTRLAPQLAEWLPFVIPLYGRGWRTDRIGAGLWLYDLLAGWPRGRRHRRLSREEALALAPTLDPDGLRGAHLYYDARTDDTRLTMAVLRSALDGGAVAVNYAEVTGFIKDGDQVTGVTVHDRIGGDAFAVGASVIVNATGPWTDWTLALAEPAAPRQLAPSKGVHLLVPAGRLPVEAAVLAPSPAGDNRFIFVVPWHGAVLLGTTDTAFVEHPDAVAADAADIDYILAAANTVFPAAGLTRADVISTTAGLRPLLAAQGTGAQGTGAQGAVAPGAAAPGAGAGGSGQETANLRREHKIWTSPSGVLNIAGGKLTTYRTMAMQVTERVFRLLGRPSRPSRTASLPLDADRPARLAQLIAADPDLDAPLVAGLPFTRAEAAFAAAAELAVFPDDVLARRTRAALLDPVGSDAAREDVAELIERYGGGQAVGNGGGPAAGYGSGPVAGYGGGPAVGYGSGPTAVNGASEEG